MRRVGFSTLNSFLLDFVSFLGGSDLVVIPRLSYLIKNEAHESRMMNLMPRWDSTKWGPSLFLKKKKNKQKKTRNQTPTKTSVRGWWNMRDCPENFNKVQNKTKKRNKTKRNRTTWHRSRTAFFFSFFFSSVPHQNDRWFSYPETTLPWTVIKKRFAFVLFCFVFFLFQEARSPIRWRNIEPTFGWPLTLISLAVLGWEKKKENEKKKEKKKDKEEKKEASDWLVASQPIAEVGTGQKRSLKTGEKKNGRFGLVRFFFPSVSMQLPWRQSKLDYSGRVSSFNPTGFTRFDSLSITGSRRKPK